MEWDVEVRKSALYLDRCVKSFLAQSFTDYEIIIVDDGSTDRTGEIADSYVGKYDFIKCIHKDNGGLSSARNAGIAEAKGQFIHMCDADDWVTPTFLEIIATKAIGDIGIASQVPDIVKFNYYRHVDGKWYCYRHLSLQRSLLHVQPL